MIYKRFENRYFKIKKPFIFTKCICTNPNFKYKSYNIIIFGIFYFVFFEKVFTYPQRTFIYNKRKREYKLINTTFNNQ